MEKLMLENLEGRGMKMKDLKYYVLSIAMAAALLLVVGDAFGQSNQYQRPGKKTETLKPADTKGAPAPAAAKDSKNEKLDIQQIESEYWQQKDTDFHVVQNRKFSKEKRYYTSVGAGPLINDSFSTGEHYMVSGGYYFKEQYGVELSYSAWDLQDSKTTKAVLARGAIPNHNKVQSMMAATFNWMPIYGKISLFDKSIIYFDMGINVGLGFVKYEQQKEENASEETKPMLVLDITQQFFISEHVAFRFDVKNRFYQQTVKEWRTGDTGSKDENEHNLSAIFGLIYYF